MQRLSIKEIIRLIEAEKPFDAIAGDGSFQIKIEKYVPYCCTAIHDGNHLRESLVKKIALDEYERWYEEDPFTGDFIKSMPITLVGCDSRYEYDLNRPTESCVHIEAWGKNVWKKQLTPKELEISTKKHENYYKVTHALIKKLEEKFNGCIVYDIHSYNHVRWDRKVPLFNIGIENIDSKKYKKVIDNWVDELKSIKLSEIENTTGVNDVFYGRGFNLEYITKNFSKTLVFATEVKKVYCNELTGESYPKVIKGLQHTLKTAILNNVNFFTNEFTSWNHKGIGILLGTKTDKSINKVDKKMHQLLKNFEILSYVNPINATTEKKKFFKNKFTETPKFKYGHIRINPYEFKQELSKIPVQDISDITIRNLYENVLNSYFDKVDLIASIGTNKFLYNSLRYFGRPSKKDLENAQYLLRLPDIPGEPKRAPSLGIEQAIPAFEEGLRSYGFNAKIDVSKKVISKAMVLSSKKLVRFNPNAKFTRTEINALVEHEIGVHMVTTMNSNNYDLKIFNLGLPVNTLTQEGLAVLSEYLSGNITLKRLQKLAYRVIAVDMMCSGASFIECFKYIRSYINDDNEAFNIITRIFRGGGFTKDYVYLTGFVKILRKWENNESLENLLVGKTSLNFLPTIDEMIDRKMISKPKYITHSFKNPKLENNNEVYEYILSGLK